MTAFDHIASDLRRRLHEVRSSALRVDLTTGLLLSASLAISLALAFVLMEALGDFSRAVRTVMVVLFAGTAGGIFLRRTVVPALRLAGMLRRDDDETVARRVGEYFPSLRDRLVNALQLSATREGNAAYYSEDLTAKALEDLERSVASVDLTASVDIRPVPRAARWFALSVMIATSVLAVFPASTSGALYRLIHFEKDFIPPPAVTFEIAPGNKEIVKGDDVPIAIRVVPALHAFRRLPAELVLECRANGQDAPDETVLRPDSSGLYRTILTGVRTTIRYNARYAGIESPRYTLSVLDRPVIRSFRVRLHPPAYTGQAERLQDEFVGDVQAPEGTRITITGTASHALDWAWIALLDSVRVPMTVSGERFSGSLTVRGNAAYELMVMDAESLANSEPVRYRIVATADEPPTVSILQPGRNVDLAGYQQLGILARAKDDYGFSSMRLGYRLVKSRFEGPGKDTTWVPMPLPAASGPAVDVPMTWNLAPLDLVPEDVVEYFVEVYDNDAVHGPKRGRSSIYLIRLPSLDEVFSDASQQHEQSLQDLSKTLEQAKELQKDVDALNRDLKTNKDPDWQTQKKLENMAAKYKEIQQKVDQVQKRLGEMTQAMEQQNVLSRETLEKYLELQQLMEQMNSAELQRLLRQTQQSMSSLTKEQLQQAMQQMTFSEERFRQSIERTLDLLKRIQIEQRMDELRKRADELKTLQKELSDRTASDSAGKTPDAKELARQQEELSRNERSMEQSAEDLQKRMEEFFTEMPSEKLRQLNQELQRQGLDRAMKQAASQMQQGNMSQAQETQQQIEQQLDQYRQQLEALQQQMLEQQSQATLNALRKATADLLDLSKDEERLKDDARSAPPNSPQLRQNAQKQQEVAEDLHQVIKDLMDLSQRSFAVTPEMGKSIGEALAHMNSAMRGLESRNGAMASQEQGLAMAALNQASIQMQGAMASLMKSGGAGSLMQQLQQMAGRQMGINVQTQQLGNGMTPQQAAQAARLAQEQDAVRKSLEQLNREAQASGEQDKLLGDLGRIAEEMKDVVRNLEQNNVNPATVRQQDRILSRLLDASKSMRERDYEKRRRAETGTNVRRTSPAELNAEAMKGRDKVREDLLRALEQGYSRDYQELIRQYFERLEKEGLLN